MGRLEPFLKKTDAIELNLLQDETRKMLLATLLDIRRAKHRAHKVMSWLWYVKYLRSSHDRQILCLNIFQEVYKFLQCNHSIPGLVYPKESVPFNLQVCFVNSWLNVLREHYDIRVKRAHVHPESYDAVYNIVRRHISNHKKLERANERMRQLDAEILWIATL